MMSVCLRGIMVIGLIFLKTFEALTIALDFKCTF